MFSRYHFDSSHFCPLNDGKARVKRRLVGRARRVAIVEQDRVADIAFDLFVPRL